MEATLAIWRRSGLPVPTNVLGLYNGKTWYVTVSDNSTVCIFMSGRNKVYACVKSKCTTRLSGDGQSYWEIAPDALQVISCTKPSYTDIERFVIDNVIKLFPTL